MKDFLQDLIQNTHGLGIVELVKITGTDTLTKVEAIAEDRSVIISGTYKTPVADVIGTFGMPNLGKLRTILGFSEEYDENANISIVREIKDGNQKQMNSSVPNAGLIYHCDLEQLIPGQLIFLPSANLVNMFSDMSNHIQEYVKLNNEYIQIKIQEEKVKNKK